MKIKICGLTRLEDIAAANAALPDYIGFVFAPSKRQITPARAAALKAALDPRIQAVGVFVDALQQEILALAAAGTIDTVQLHGKEDAQYIAALREQLSHLQTSQNPACHPRAIAKQSVSPVSGYGINSARACPRAIAKQSVCEARACPRAIAKQSVCEAHETLGETLGQTLGIPPIIKAMTVAELAEFVCPNADGLPDYLLLDNPAAGSGVELAELQTHTDVLKTAIVSSPLPVFLAGGININNIAAALELKPFAIDISSGAEINGIKDADKISELVLMSKASA